MKIFAIALLTLMLSGCAWLRPTPEAKLNRLLNRYPELLKSDTFTWQHLWRNPGQKWDSLIDPRGYRQGDTLSVKNKRFTIKFFQPGTPEDPLWVGVDIPDDSAKINGYVVSPRVAYSPPDRLSELIRSLPWIALLLASLVLGMIFVKRK